LPDRKSAVFERPGAARGLVSRICETLFSVLFPSDRRSCAFPLLSISWLHVCPACLDQIHPVRGKVYSVCTDRVLSSYAEHDPDGLRRGPICRVERPFERAVAYGSYQGGLRELFHLLKYNGVRPAAGVLGRMLSETMQTLEPVLEDATVLLIPVPLFKSRRRQRGFNWAELIAPLPGQKRFGLRSLLKNSLLGGAALPAL
jgi:predicted amidophosphoribosyltransferase